MATTNNLDIHRIIEYIPEVMNAIQSGGLG